MEGKIKIGPAGKDGKKSHTMVNWDEGSHNGILSQIFLSHGSTGILSIQFQFILDDKFVLSDQYGQNNGSMFDVITLNCPHEYITGISGEYSKYSSTGSPDILTLTFTTNTSEYGPFGYLTPYKEEKFQFKLGKSSQFGGFYGSYDVSGLQCIGLHLQPNC